MGFFIPVSSLKVFGHSILRGGGFIQGNQYKLYKMTPLSYHGYSVSESSSQGAVQWHTLKTFMFVFILSFSLQNLYKVFD